jgi:hypothetical protein
MCHVARFCTPVTQNATRALGRIRANLHAFERRWRIERAGTLTAGYGAGWIATRYDGELGKWCRTWSEALAYVNAELWREVGL